MSTTSPRSRFFDLPAGRRHVLEWGREGAPVLMLQHGMRDNAASWHWVVKQFYDDFHIIAPDLRGHGDSDWSPDGAYALFDFVHDLVQILDIYDHRKIHLVGHSLGGHVALRLAAVAPERFQSLCVIEAIELPIVREQMAEAKTYPELMRQWMANRAKQAGQTPRRFTSVAEAAARMQAQFPFLPADEAETMTRQSLTPDGDGFRWKHDNACRFRAPDDQHGHDIDEILAAIACPTLLCYGTASWIPVPKLARLNRLARHRLARFEGAGHHLHHQMRNEFCGALREFLSNPSQFNEQKDHYYA